MATLVAPPQPVQQNNHGAELLNKGLIDEATEKFKGALKVTRDMLVRQVEKVDVEQQTMSSLGECEEGLWACDASTIRGCSFLVYQKPVSIDRDVGDIPVHRLSAVLLFNLAIAYHMKAMASSPSKDTFQKVVHLYEHAYRLLSQDKHPESFFLSMAILNNLAHLHFKLQRQHEAELLCSALWTALLQSENQADKTAVLDGFFNNVVQVVFKHPQSAAAA